MLAGELAVSDEGESLPLAGVYVPQDITVSAVQIRLGTPPDGGGVSITIERQGDEDPLVGLLIDEGETLTTIVLEDEDGPRPLVLSAGDVLRIGIFAVGDDVSGSDLAVTLISE